MCQRVQERTRAEIISEKRKPPSSPQTHTHTHTTLSPDLWKKATDGPFFFGQVPADSCPGYREVRWCLYGLELGGWGGVAARRRSEVKHSLAERIEAQAKWYVQKRHTCRQTRLIWHSCQTHPYSSVFLSACVCRSLFVRPSACLLDPPSSFLSLSPSLNQAIVSSWLV